MSVQDFPFLRENFGFYLAFGRSVQNTQTRREVVECLCISYECISGDKSRGNKIRDVQVPTFSIGGLLRKGF